MMIKRCIEYYKSHKLSFNMIAVNTAIAVLPIIILGVIAYNIYSTTITEKMSYSIEMSFQQMNGRIDEYFNSMNNFSKSIFFNKTVLNILESDPKLLNSQSVFTAREYFGSIALINKSYRGIYLITNEGRQVGTSNYGFGQELLSYVESNREIIEQNNNLLFLAPGSIEHLNQSGIVAIRQIRFVDSFKKAGIGVLLLDRKNLIELVESTYQIAGIKVFVLDAKDKLVAATDEKDLQLMDAVRETDMQEGKEIVVGNERFFVKQTTQNEAKWRFIAVVPLDNAYKERAMLRYTIFFVILIIMSLAITATLLFNVSIGRQIKKLSDAFDKVASGDLKVQLRFKAKNEITAIGNNFNIMVQEIKLLTKKIFTTQQRLYESELQKTAAELYGLQSQINSHFLYNTLNSIRGMARSGAVEEVDGMIYDLVSILRYATIKSEFVMLQNELEHLKNYIRIQKTGDRLLKLLSEIDNDVKCCKVQKLILQPIVENSIMHGLKNKTNGLIKVSAYSKDDNLIIKVFDNGEGMSEKILTGLNNTISNLSDNTDGEEKHIGLMNIQKRIKATYGSNYGISVKSWHGTGTVVILKIPCKY